MEHINKVFEEEEEEEEEEEDSIIRHSSNKAKRDLRTASSLLYHRLGDSNKGINGLQDALKLNPQNSFAMLNLGIIYSDLENHN